MPKIKNRINDTWRYKIYNNLNKVINSNIK